VTGANGGVGSIAVAILANLGHHVIAATGRPQHADRLRDLGAAGGHRPSPWSASKAPRPPGLGA
jgi:NADPH:quinone reductase-like Zn-dependent oxidoreductase